MRLIRRLTVEPPKRKPRRRLNVTEFTSSSTACLLLSTVRLLFFQSKRSRQDRSTADLVSLSCPFSLRSRSVKAPDMIQFVLGQQNRRFVPEDEDEEEKREHISFPTLLSLPLFLFTPGRWIPMKLQMLTGALPLPSPSPPLLFSAFSLHSQIRPTAPPSSSRCRARL
jgi:hypothetical protein